MSMVGVLSLRGLVSLSAASAARLATVHTR